MTNINLNTEEQNFLKILLFSNLKKEQSHDNWRSKAPFKEGWRYAKDFYDKPHISNLKEQGIINKSIIVTHIPSIRKKLKKYKLIEQRKITTKDDRKRTVSKIAIRLRQEEATLKELIKFYIHKYELHFLMTSDYYNDNPSTKLVLNEYAENFDIPKNPTGYIYSEIFDSVELLIIGLPQLYILFLENKKEFHTQMKELCSLFPSKAEFGHFLTIIGCFIKWADLPVRARKNTFNQIYRAYKSILYADILEDQENRFEDAHLGAEYMKLMKKYSNKTKKKLIGGFESKDNPK